MATRNGRYRRQILLEGIRAEISVAELCRREGIHPTVYYTWLKDFMEAGKVAVLVKPSPAQYVR